MNATSTGSSASQQPVGKHIGQLSTGLGYHNNTTAAAIAVGKNNKALEQLGGPGFVNVKRHQSASKANPQLTINGDPVSKVKKIANIITNQSKELQITSKNLGATPKEFTNIKHQPTYSSGSQQLKPAFLSTRQAASAKQETKRKAADLEKAIHQSKEALPATLATPEQSSSKATNKIVMIRVKDEARSTSQDFRCDKMLLLQGMKYFEKHLAKNDADDLEDIDIAVHCDITIFDWLMKYVHGLEPPMELKTAVSILISAEFLQMDDLVEESLTFVG